MIGQKMELQMDTKWTRSGDEARRAWGYDSRDKSVVACEYCDDFKEAEMVVNSSYEEYMRGLHEAEAQFLRKRGVSAPCIVCRGVGVLAYPNKSTWRRSVGEACLTYDVCGECWGTGDRFRHGTNIRRLEGKIQALENDLYSKEVASRFDAIEDEDDE
jgi:hypothetical protein